MNHDKDKCFAADDFPSTKEAYSAALKAYDWAIQRIGALDRLIVSVAGWMTTVMLASIAINVRYADSSGVLFFSVLPIFIYIVGIVFSSVALLKEKILMLDPMNLHKKDLHKQEHVFQADVIYDAGEAWKNNNALIHRKAKYLSFIIVCFTVEMILLCLWAWGIF